MTETRNARCCKTLKWAEFPEKENEFKGLGSLKVHDLTSLLRFTGREATVKTTLLREWSIVLTWSPDLRYRPIGAVTKGGARLMLDSANVLLRKL